MDTGDIQAVAAPAVLLPIDQCALLVARCLRKVAVQCSLCARGRDLRERRMLRFWPGLSHVL